MPHCLSVECLVDLVYVWFAYVSTTRSKMKSAVIVEVAQTGDCSKGLLKCVCRAISHWCVVLVTGCLESNVIIVSRQCSGCYLPGVVWRESDASGGVLSVSREKRCNVQLPKLAPIAPFIFTITANLVRDVSKASAANNVRLLWRFWCISLAGR